MSCGTIAVTSGSFVPLMARDVAPLLKRMTAVPKSAFQKPENRPSAQQHFDSMDVDLLVPPPTRIVLIDDIVTRGTTLLAAATRIAQVYPKAQIRAYAPVRTMSHQEIASFEDPCVGAITPQGKWARRDP
jgi:Phosphoribosyl transferase domain